jgi:hypothetical protein
MKLSTLLFADDQVIISDSDDNLQMITCFTLNSTKIWHELFTEGN